MWERGLKYNLSYEFSFLSEVAPLVGAWIEIPVQELISFVISVAPLVGAWIEISKLQVIYNSDSVAPLVGAWIEIISRTNIPRNNFYVAPLVGAWIEISAVQKEDQKILSLPLWERGLKLS